MKIIVFSVPAKLKNENQQSFSLWVGVKVGVHIIAVME